MELELSHSKPVPITPPDIPGKRRRKRERGGDWEIERKRGRKREKGVAEKGGKKGGREKERERELM